MVEPDSRRVRAVEALLRWQPEGGRLLPAAEFISIAEDSGLILPIGDWVLRTGLRDAARWYSAHRISVSVNVSGRQLDEADFADTVMAALSASGLPGDALVLEIAERTLVNSSRSRTLHQHLRRLRANGVRVAVDDFGTGYSSLSYVAELPVDIVKIDKSFTQGPEGAGFAPREWDFTRAILQLVESLNKVAVAKGVRTEAQAEAMRVLHCPLVQGFLFGRPEPAEAIDRILDAGLIPSAGHGAG
jgi:EAL domain-containing protein (putative c-di-GMP-specific phosphodiesterase class I)